MTMHGTVLGLRNGSLAVVPHQTVWAEMFEAEAVLIRAALPKPTPAIDHIGSTAVPGLSAKPILDIALRAPKIEEARIANALVKIGYIDRGIRSGRLFIRLRDGDVRTHNLHLYEPDDPDCLDQITFRNALRRDPDLRSRYAALKQQLVRHLGDAGRREYAPAKTSFVREAIEGLR